MRDSDMCLDRHVSYCRQREFILKDMIRLGKTLIQIASLASVQTGYIAIGLGEENTFNVIDLGNILVYKNICCQRLIQTYHRFQNFIFNFNQSDCLLSEHFTRGSDCCYGLSLIAGFAFSQHPFVLHVETHE